MVFLQKTIGFVFSVSFTKRVLFGHAKNKTTCRKAGGLLCLWRREGDSNPRSRDCGTTVFETAAFDHSAISPFSYSAILQLCNSPIFPFSSYRTPRISRLKPEACRLAHDACRLPNRLSKITIISFVIYSSAIYWTLIKNLLILHQKNNVLFWRQVLISLFCSAIRNS
jgi:hypothetical protein